MKGQLLSTNRRIQINCEIRIMSKGKKFRIKGDDIKRVIPALGACIATDNITVEGLPIGYMYREDSEFDVDSGWRIFSGTETQEYVDDAKNMEVYDLNTIANYDQSIIPYLGMPAGTELERVANTDIFEEIK